MGTTMRLGNLKATIARLAWLFLFAIACVGAVRDAHAAKKDASMCDGLKGKAHGVCMAAAALGCSDAGKHQKQCDALGDKFEALTGDVPPWEAPPPPPPPPPPSSGTMETLAFDTDALDLETGSPCRNALGAACNQDDTGFIRPPNDFWMSFDPESPTEAIFVPVLACDSSEFIVGVAVLTGVPFASVDASMLESLVFQETALEVPMGPGDTVVLRTCDVGFFKIGNVAVGANVVTFSYEELGF